MSRQIKIIVIIVSVIVLLIASFAIWKSVEFHKAESIVKEYIKNKYDIETDVKSVRLAWLADPLVYRVDCVTSDEKIHFNVTLKTNIMRYNKSIQSVEHYVSGNDLFDSVFYKKMKEYLQNNYSGFFDDGVSFSATNLSPNSQELKISQSVFEMNDLITDYTIFVRLHYYSNSEKEGFAKSIVDFINAINESGLTPNEYIIIWEDKQIAFFTSSELSYNAVLEKMEAFNTFK